MADNAVIKDENGNEHPVKVPEVNADTAREAIKTVLPVLKEHGESIGQALRDTMEEGLEKMAKSLEKDTPVIRDYSKERQMQGGPSVLGDQIVHEEERMSLFGDYMRALGGGRKGDLSKAKKFAEHTERTSADRDLVTKALSESEMDSMGILVPETVRDTVRELRDNATVIRQIAPEPIRVRGNITLPRELSRATAFYQDENEDLTLTEFTMGQEKIVPKKLTVLVAASNELLQDATNVEQLILRQMRRAYTLKEDLKFLRGDGTGAQPMGLRNMADSSNVSTRTQAGSDSTVDEIRGDLVDAMVNIKKNNHNVSNATATWMFPSTTWGGLFKRLADDNSMAPFAAELVQGRLLGLPYRETNQIPDDLGAGDEAEVFLVINDYIVIIDSEEIRIDASQDASYKDANGNDKSAFSLDQSVWRLIGRSEIHYEYSDGISIIDTVDW